MSIQKESSERKWVKQADAAKHLSCSESFLEVDRCTGKLKIPFHKLGRHVRYDLAELDQWLESRRGE